MLLNCSNHPYGTWSTTQCEAAVRQYGEVIDLPFPRVDPQWDISVLRQEVSAYAKRIEAHDADAVFAAGEFTFLFMLVDRLLDDGIEVVCSCSERNTVESIDEHGNNVKTSVFAFKRFRPYRRWCDVRTNEHTAET